MENSFFPNEKENFRFFGFFLKKENIMLVLLYLDNYDFDFIIISFSYEA